MEWRGSATANLSLERECAVRIVAVDSGSLHSRARVRSARVHAVPEVLAARVEPHRAAVHHALLAADRKDGAPHDVRSDEKLMGAAV